MANHRRFEIDELLVRPGTYFNPQTEVLVVVDDSVSPENDIFEMEEYEGADWVLITDELPVDEARRDELLEDFQSAAHDGAEGSPSALADPEAAANVGDQEDDDPPRAVVPIEEE